MKKNNNKGFTLMEMLIVVAIIAVLIAIAIPTFSNSLNKARDAADEANGRALYAALASAVMLDEVTTAPTGSTSISFQGTTYTFNKGATCTIDTTNKTAKVVVTLNSGSVTFPGATKSGGASS